MENFKTNKMKQTFLITAVVFAFLAVSWQMYHMEEANTLFYLTAISALFLGAHGFTKDKEDGK